MVPISLDQKDLTKPKPNNIANDTPTTTTSPTKMLSNTNKCVQTLAQLMKFNSSNFQKLLAEKMASSYNSTYLSGLSLSLSLSLQWFHINNKQ